MSAARTRRWALAATPILAAHLGLALLMHGQAEPIVEAPQTPPMMVELVEPPPPPPPPPARVIAPDPSPKPDAPAAAAQAAAPPKPAPQRRPPAVAAVAAGARAWA
ncbi:energy transducer TonB, partial [Brevundimonas sp. SPF441]|nr:energy transducer TonB [Brevundimonas sp. SPF441]